MHNLELQFRGNRFWEIIWKFPCPQKILMVTDSSLNFGAGGFGVSEFVSIITNAGHTVATASQSYDIGGLVRWQTSLTKC